MVKHMEVPNIENKIYVVASALCEATPSFIRRLLATGTLRSRRKERSSQRHAIGVACVDQFLRYD
jgi:hypothetical protein